MSNQFVVEQDESTFQPVRITINSAELVSALAYLLDQGIDMEIDSEHNEFFSELKERLDGVNYQGL